MFPNAWKRGLIVAIRKGDDKDPEVAKSYRPICLLPVLGKVFERILVGKMEQVFYRSISERQFGFMKGRSTVDAMNMVLERAERSPSRYCLLYTSRCV